MLSIEEIRALGEVNPDFVPVLDSVSPLLASRDETTITPQYRAMMQAAKDAAPKIDPATLSHLQDDIRIQGARQPHRCCPASTSLDKTSPEGRPALVVFHGGGYSVGDLAVVVARMCLNDGLSPPLTGMYAAMPGGVNHETVPDKYKDRFISLEQDADAPDLSVASVAFISRKICLSSTYAQILEPIGKWFTLISRLLSYPARETHKVDDVYPGMPHAFRGLFPELGISERRRGDAEEGLGWLLRR